MRPQYFRTITLLLFCIVTSVATASADDWGKVSDEEWDLVWPANYPEANAAIIFDRCSTMVTPDIIETSRHVRMKIFRKAGADEIGDIDIEYRKGDKIKDLKAQTILPGGKKVEVAGKDFFTKTVDEWETRTFSFPSADSGCIVEYRYRNLNTRYTYLDPWFFQNDVYTLHSRLALTLYPGFTYSSSYSNVPLMDREPAVSEFHRVDDRDVTLKTFIWERENLPPITDEPFMGPKLDYFSAMYYQLVEYKTKYVHERFVRNWTDLGKEYQEWLDEYVRGARLDDIIASATAGANSPDDKVKKLYEYVAAKFAVKEEISRRFWSHDHLGEMVKLGYGTAEEKNLLLTELVRKAGIKAFPVLIGTREYRRFNPDICQLHQFDHMLTFVEFDSGFVFLDATTKYCPFGLLPPRSLVEAGFLVDGDKSEVVRVATSQPKSYRMDVTHITIDDIGVARCSTSCSFSGYLAPQYGQWSEDETPEDFAESYFTDKVSEQAELDTCFYGLDSTGRFTLTVVYTVKDFARELDNHLVVKPIAYRFAENPFKKEKRHISIDFDFPQIYHNMVFIHSERPVAEATLPPTQDVTATGLSYKRLSQFQEGVVQLDAKLVISEPTFAPANYKEVKQFFEGVAGASQEEVTLQLGVVQ